MPQTIEACNVRVDDLIGIEDGSCLQVMKITSAKSKGEKALNFYFDDGSVMRKIALEEGMFLLCRPAV